MSQEDFVRFRHPIQCELETTAPTSRLTSTSPTLRQSTDRPSRSNMRTVSQTPRPRKSKFIEVDLDVVGASERAADVAEYARALSWKEARQHGRDVDHRRGKSPVQGRLNVLSRNRWRPRTARAAANAPPTYFSSISRVALITFLIAIVLPSFGHKGSGSAPADGADAGVLRHREQKGRNDEVEGRAASPTSICTRWSHQSAVVNGTCYIYGGRAKTSSGQTTNTWNNDFLSLDLTKNWQISAPPLTGLPQPSGPPPVANGYLWNSFTSLFLYGGEFSDTPATAPVPDSTWEYSLSSNSWIEHASPATSAGTNSDPAGVPIQRSAEGAGLSVPELGLSWYFGGHQDVFTTFDWSLQIARIYLKSMLEFTHPGYSNPSVQGLNGNAGSAGVYRNVTQGGLQTDAGFTERADGVLVYVPGWGTNGILLGLAGGTADTFTEMNEIDIYDIASSTWYKQATSGTYPSIRVNPCAVVFSAPDASSFQVHLYGGQNLQPAGAQTQYSDMWILTVPSFTWISVDTSKQSQPPARAGHTCHAWDGQMVVVGGYVGTQISCDSPGIYVFNASSLSWQNSFVALSGSKGQSVESGSSTLAGSYGYQVPQAVLSVIGGAASGGATATSPQAGAGTLGPLATGKPPAQSIIQVASSSAQTVQSTAAAATSVVAATTAPTVTATLTGAGMTTAIVASTVSNIPATSAVTNSPSSQTSTPSAASSTTSAADVGAIVAGSIAGLLAVLVAYLAFCTWLYKRQLTLYKNHVAMSQRASLGYSSSPVHGRRSQHNEKGIPIFGPFGTEIGRRDSDAARSGGSDTLLPHAGDLSSSKSSGRTNAAYASLAGDAGDGDANEIGGSTGERPELGGLGSLRAGRASMGSSTDDLLGEQELSFFSVVMSPRRTLRVINRD